MKRQAFITVAVMTLFNNSFFINTVTSCAVTDAQIHEQDRIINSLKQQEEEALRQVRESEEQIRLLRENQKRIQSEKVEHEEISKKLSEKIARLCERIEKRRVAIASEGRSVQVKGQGGVLKFLRTLCDANSISELFAKAEGVLRMMDAQRDLWAAQKRDIKLVISEQEKNQDHINALAKNLAEMEAVENALASENERLQVRKLELNVQRTTEEGKRNELLAQKAAAEAAAREAQVRREEDRRQRENAQKEMAERARPRQAPQSFAVETSSSGGRSSSSSEVVASTPPLARRVSSSGSYYPTGQCTWYAKSRCPWVPSCLGNANSWSTGASVLGYAVDSSPVPGAVACFRVGCHVAVVEHVDKGRVYISEGNYSGHYNERWISSSECTYIHP